MVSSTVEPPVSDHPKCEDLVVAYGRWSLTRIEPQGVSPEKSSDTSFLRKRIYCMQFPSSDIQLFRERLSEKVHATIPKGIVGGFEYTILQRNLKEWHERPWTYVCELLKESNKRKFDSYSVRNGVLIISHITFRDCRVHIFSNNLSRNSCVQFHVVTKVLRIFLVG